MRADEKAYFCLLGLLDLPVCLTFFFQGLFFSFASFIGGLTSLMSIISSAYTA